MSNRTILTINVREEGAGYAADFVGRTRGSKEEWKDTALPARTPVKAAENALVRISEVAASGRGPGRKKRGYWVALDLAYGPKNSK